MKERFDKTFIVLFLLLVQGATLKIVYSGIDENPRFIDLFLLLIIVVGSWRLADLIYKKLK